MGVQVLRVRRAIPGLAEEGDLVRVDSDNHTVLLMRELADAALARILSGVMAGELVAEEPAPGARLSLMR